MINESTGNDSHKENMPAKATEAKKATRAKKTTQAQGKTSTPIKRPPSSTATAARAKSASEPKRVKPLAGVRHANESDCAVIACNDYIAMPHRSLRDLHRQYS